MCKYKVRYFYSKGAFLVLVWTLLVTIAITSTSHNLSTFFHLCDLDKTLSIWIFSIPVVIGLLGAVFSGWLADAKLGNYRVVKYSIILLFITSIVYSIVTLLPCSVLNMYTIAVGVWLGGSIFVLAAIASAVTALQLGLDQMPDASSTSITSFIAWFLFCGYAGYWAATLIYYIAEHCTMNSDTIQLASLISPICMTLTLVSDFVLNRKWLIIEPKSPQSFKIMYQVLKFAWKHKAPLNRSALTYWEEDIPSRLDLGKSRYGGPFTTEQVEDVKTILRLIPLCLIMWLLGSILTTLITSSNEFVGIVIVSSACEIRVWQSFTYSSFWCGMVWTILYEFVIYPIIRNKLPSILKRIEIISLLIMTISFVTLILQLLFYYNSNIKAIHSAIIFIHSVSRGLLSLLLASTMLEFICAQAPYNMRGKFGGWIVFILVFSFSLKTVVPHTLIMYGIGTGLSLLGFIIFCLLARWYKRRVRDEEYCIQTEVEKVYDRYLSAKYPGGAILQVQVHQKKFDTA